MNPLQSRREFLKTIEIGAIGLSLPDLTILSRNNLVQSLTLDPGEAFEQRYHQLVKISDEEKFFNNPFEKLGDDIKLKAELVHHKLLGDLLFDPNLTMNEARRRFKSLYKTLTDIIQSNPTNLEKIFHDLQENSLDQYYERLRNIFEISGSFNHLIPGNILTIQELTSFEKIVGEYIKTLATREKLENYECYELLKAFFTNGVEGLKANHRLNDRKKLVTELHQ